MLTNILTALDSNTQPCITNHVPRFRLTSDRIRNFFFGLMHSGELYMASSIMPAVIFRLNRCNSDDIHVLNYFFRKNFGDITSSRIIAINPALLFSSALHYHIAQSELWLAENEMEVDQETITAWHRSALAASEDAEEIVNLHSQWPKYPLDKYHHQIASFTPLLMISGELDPITVFDQAAQLASATSGQRTFYKIPFVGHGVANLARIGYQCPLQLISSWLFPEVFPMEWQDVKCIDDLPTRLDFTGETMIGRDFSMQFSNISRPFENGP